jgi:hypothetical protein
MSEIVSLFWKLSAVAGSGTAPNGWHGTGRCPVGVPCGWPQNGVLLFGAWLMAWLAARCVACEQGI